MDMLPHLMEEFASWIGHGSEPVLRLFLAAGLGGIIGLEREASGKPAGFRTNMLICVGAALITELSIEVARDGLLPGGLRSDPGRIAAQIVSGIGFLGAGTILRSQGSVTGLTTAATLWVVAAIGMATGAGSYVLALVGTALVMLALMILGRFEDHLLPRTPSERRVRVVLQPRPDLIGELEQLLVQAGLQVATVDVEKRDEVYVASFTAHGVAGLSRNAADVLLAQDGVQKVSLL